MNLDQVILKYRDRSFRYGYSDCCLFTKDCIEASQNIKIDHIFYDGSFKTLRQNYKDQKAKKLKDFLQNILQQNGFVEVKDGPIHNDVLLLKNNGRFLAGFQINRFSLSVSAKGLIQLDEKSVIKVFRKRV